MDATEQQKELEEKKYKCETKLADVQKPAVSNMLEPKEDFEREMLKNPMFAAQLMISLKDERERTNSMLATVIRKIEALEMKIEALESELAKSKRKTNGKEDLLLGEVDSELVAYIRKRKMVTAEEVQAHFNYKGKNAASSRMHRLYSIGLLDKRQAGRKVYYLAK